MNRCSKKDTDDANSPLKTVHADDGGGGGGSGGGSGANNNADAQAKTTRITKQYACNQCSYSADKKVSLNRHMRMHQTSPTSSSVTSNGDDCSSQVKKPFIYIIQLFIYYAIASILVCVYRSESGCAPARVSVFNSQREKKISICSIHRFSH